MSTIPFASIESVIEEPTHLPTIARHRSFVERHLLVNTRTMAFKSQVNIEELPDFLSRTLNDHTNKVLMNIERGQQFLSDKLDDFSDQIVMLKSEVRKLKAENEQLKTTLASLSSKTQTVTDAVHKQEAELDSHRRSELSSNAIVVGLPRVPNENTESLVDAMCHTLGLKISKDSIISCTRMSATKGANNLIRIKFNNAHAKECLLARKKQFGSLTVSMIPSVRWPSGWTNKVFIRDDLSPLSMEIFQAIRLQQPKLKFRYVWPGRNGIIYVKYAKDSQPIKVRSRADLQKLISNAQ